MAVKAARTEDTLQVLELTCFSRPIPSQTALLEILTSFAAHRLCRLDKALALHKVKPTLRPTRVSEEPQKSAEEAATSVRMTGV